MNAIRAVAATMGVFIAACSSSPRPAPPNFASGGAPCPEGNAGLTLPAGFCASIFADSLRAPRHLAVAPNGDVFVAVMRDSNAAAVFLRDSSRDGRADMRALIGRGSATGLVLDGRSLYVALNDAVLRYRVNLESPLGIEMNPDTIVSGLLSRRQHAAKSIALGGDMLFVNIGAPSNACQAQDRTPGSAGRDPCTLLDSAGGIWRFDARRTGQRQADGQRYSAGLRNVVALTWDAGTRGLYGLSHGRDDLARLYPALYTTAQNAEKPAEEFFRLEENADYGWPYCNYDPELRQKILNPEYGGDGRTAGRCASVGQPIAAYPAHWAPNGVVIYRGNQFPAEYRGGAFIAFHGSWNRAPLPQQGYNVVFQPMANGRPSGQYTVFADGFRGTGTNAANRPTGLAVGPDGALYVSDDTGGRIYRIWYNR
jgi:glucose/arabinose dehydrogenase